MKPNPAPRRILVTSALPYANGALHIGHLVEHIQTDIWVRFQKMVGNECHYVCADDAHGAPIMLRARALGISCQALIDEMKAAHRRDFAGFYVDHHFYHSTESEENRRWTQALYARLQDKGLIVRKRISQAFDEQQGMFLADRYIKGTCPHCAAPEQYGDSCEKCGKTYSALELINPISVLSQCPPVVRETEHLFLDLPQCASFLKAWIEDGDIDLQAAMRNKMAEWFKDGLKAWDITRDAPYWGFEIPDEPGKYFYVWLDAPVGYIASFDAYCQSNNLQVSDFWQQGSDTELYHFIGKDIAYFHMLFWPAVLQASGLRCPSGVFVHGFLTVDGRKMSKSRGTFIQASTYLKYLNPEYLRYYYAAKLSSEVEDLDLSITDFKNRVNSELVGKLVNLASRCAPFILNHFEGQLAEALPTRALFDACAEKAAFIAECYERRDYAQAVREIMHLTDAANAYIDAEKPWIKIKETATAAAAQGIATVGLNAFRQLMTFLKPVLPKMAAESEAFLEIAPLCWADAQQPLLAHKISPFKPLMQRVEEKDLQKMLADSVDTLAQEQPQEQPKEQTQEQPKNKEEIAIDDFAKLDLRIAKVLHCEAVAGSDKLLKFQLDVGNLGTRQVFSGIAKAHKPEDLMGKWVVYIANLKPRKMRFGLSEGMLLSASDGQGLTLLMPTGNLGPGMEIG